MKHLPATLAVALALAIGSTATAQATDVTFRVDMSVQTQSQDFFPGLDTVELHGGFNDWAAGITLSESQTDPGVYEETVDLTGAPGTAVDYKFVINQNGSLVWEGNVGSEGAQNRSVDTPELATVLPVVLFNNQTSLPGNVAVTFQVNLSIQRLIGNFDPAADTVVVRGSFDGWASGATLSVNATDPDLYQVTLEVFGASGALQDYKFVINRGGTLVWEGDVGPAGAQNRTFALGETNQTLPVVYFDNLASDPGAGVPVTFAVNLSVQAALGLFDPGLDAVVVAGQFNAWNTTDAPLTNSVEEPYIYHGTIGIQSAAGSPVPHKFVVNGTVWEDGDNRTFLLAETAQTLPVVYFNRQDDLGPIVVSAVSGGQITLEWTAAPAVRLQNAPAVTSVWSDVAGSTGQGSATWPLGDKAGFFRLTGP